MKKLIFAALAVLTLGAVALTGCDGSTNYEPDAQPATYDKYLVDDDFDSEKLATIYGDMRNYGFYDYLDFLDVIESDDVEPHIDYDKDVNPRFFIHGYEGEALSEIDTQTLTYNYNRNFQKSIRKSGDFMISDYKDGVCINRYLFDGKKNSDKKNLTVKIPDTLDGKRVIKLSGFIIKDKDEEYVQVGFMYDVPHKYKITLEIPESVSDISYCALKPYQYEDEPVRGRLEKIVADKKNPAFKSVDGVLYNSDKSWLYCLPSSYSAKEFKIPDSVKYVAETLDEFEGTLTIGKNVQKLYDESLSAEKVKLSRGSYAEKWFKENEIDAEVEYI